LRNHTEDKELKKAKKERPYITLPSEIYVDIPIDLTVTLE
jgi:hypothetical protein